MVELVRHPAAPPHGHETAQSVKVGREAEDLARRHGREVGSLRREQVLVEPLRRARDPVPPVEVRSLVKTALMTSLASYPCWALQRIPDSVRCSVVPGGIVSRSCCTCLSAGSFSTVLGNMGSSPAAVALWHMASAQERARGSRANV